MIMMLPRSPRVLAVSFSVLALYTGSAVAAEPLTEAQARATIAPFYNALNATAAKDVPALVIQATSPTWVSCGNNDICRPRDKVINGIANLHDVIPDLKWEIKEVLVAGNRVVVRGEATGTPSGEFRGVNHPGKSFSVMSIDVHTIEGGKMVHSYHIEDWMGATRQLAAK
jgi:hypothetical protein